MPWYQKISLRTALFISVGVIALCAATLLLMGRVPICTCGTVLLWYGNTNGPGNSQHLADWYTFTHILHGFLYYFLIWIVDRKKRLPFAVKLLIAVVLASGWEIIENSNFIIERYRAVTISLDYFGDSVINSITDILAAAFGIFLASRLRWQISLAFVIIIEFFLAYFVRDNLSINIIMLIHPIEALKIWQSHI